MAESLTFNTAEMRENPRFTAMFGSDPSRELPVVKVMPYEGEEVINRSMSRGHQILDADDTRVGTFTLVGATDKPRRYIRNIQIVPERQGERLAVATYVGVLAKLSESDKNLTSDPQHLKEASNRVWLSLERRGLARRDEEAGTDVFGFPRYIGKLLLNNPTDIVKVEK